MRIDRVWAMPNKWTFRIKPIAKLLKEEMNGFWIDPFCGENSPAQITNDLNPKINADQHKDALEFIEDCKYCNIDGCLFDPPYSVRQVAECYKQFGYKVDNKTTQANWYSDRKDMAARVIKPNGKAICFGWNSNGLGKNRGFELERILLVCHGGAHNDTIVTVERKINTSLF